MVLALLVPFGFAEFKLNEIWLSQNETIKLISLFFANLLATGINEETFFRGFVFAQLYRKFGGESANEKLQLKPFLTATFTASLVFAVMHLQFQPAAFLFLTIGRIIGCLVYARTRNLFVGIAPHGVFNSPMPLLQTKDGIAKIAVIILMLVFILIYPFLKKDKSNT